MKGISCLMDEVDRCQCAFAAGQPRVRFVCCGFAQTPVERGWGVCCDKNATVRPMMVLKRGDIAPEGMGPRRRFGEGVV
jgi:hypothetical protein